MKFIYIVALIAPAVLAATEATTENKPTDWISLLQQQCPDMAPKCVDIAKDVHQTDTKKKPNIFKDLASVGSCNPEFQKCAQKINTSISGDSANESNLKRAAEGNVITCLMQIQPDHFKFSAHPASAKTPFPRDQTCPLRDLHRVAHAALAMNSS